MTTPVIFATSTGFLGIAKETVPGTAETAPTAWISMLDPSWVPNQKVILDEAIRGSMGKYFGASTGSRYDTISYGCYPYLDTLMHHMVALYGGTDTVTGTAAPYTHSVALTNAASTGGQPPSYTLFLFNGSECWRMAGSKLGKLGIDLKADELGKTTQEWTGLAATSVATPTNTPSTAAPWPGSQTVITVGGLTASTYSDVQLQFARDVEPVITATGTATPYCIFVGPLGVEVDVTGVYTGYSGSEVEKLLTNASQAITVQCNAAGDTAHYGLWTFTSTRATAAQPKMNSGKYVEVDSKFQALNNATDAIGSGTSPGKFQILTTSATQF